MNWKFPAGAIAIGFGKNGLASGFGLKCYYEKIRKIIALFDSFFVIKNL